MRLLSHWQNWAESKFSFLFTSRLSQPASAEHAVHASIARFTGCDDSEKIHSYHSLDDVNRFISISTQIYINLVFGISVNIIRSFIHKGVFKL